MVEKYNKRRGVLVKERLKLLASIEKKKAKVAEIEAKIIDLNALIELWKKPKGKFNFKSSNL